MVPWAAAVVVLLRAPQRLSTRSRPQLLQPRRRPVTVAVLCSLIHRARRTPMPVVTVLLLPREQQPVPPLSSIPHRFRRQRWASLTPRVQQLQLQHPRRTSDLSKNLFSLRCSS